MDRAQNSGSPHPARWGFEPEVSRNLTDFRNITPIWWRSIVMALTIVVVAAVHIGHARVPGVGWLEASTRDVLMRLQSEASEDPRLALVDIDEDSLRLIGPWPWSRDRIAELAERLLSDAGATRVAFDMVMPAPSDARSLGLAPTSPTSRLDPEVRRERLGDARLEIMAREGLVILGQALDYEERAVAVEVGVALGGHRLPESVSQPRQPRAKATGHVGNHSGLGGARCVGNIGVRPDFDGKTRRLAPWTDYGELSYPTLALATMSCLPSGRADGHQGGRVGAKDHPDNNGINPTRSEAAMVSDLPIDAEGHWRVPFRHQPQAHLSVPAHEVLNGSVDLNQGHPLLAGRIVIIGSSALGLADRVATPVAASVSGASVHAEALSWLLDVRDGRASRPPPQGLMLLWTMASAALLAWSLAGQGAHLVRVGITLSAILPAWLMLAAWVARTGGVEPVSTPLVAYAFLMLVLLPAEWAGVQGQSRRQARLLTRYVAPAVLAALQRDRNADVLSPRRANITVLIADMQDYTRNTSDAGLQEAAHLTKGFLQALTGPVLAHRGTLDRYTGDGLVAFWGAPLPEPDHADLALDAAMGILREVQAFNQNRCLEGKPPVTVRMGLASGEALVGDLGTAFRIAYTAVGDCINLASRLQQASREVDVPILASHSVQEASRRHAFIDLGTLRIRGLNDQRVGTPAACRETPSTAAGDQVPG